MFTKYILNDTTLFVYYSLAVIYSGKMTALCFIINISCKFVFPNIWNSSTYYKHAVLSQTEKKDGLMLIFKTNTESKIKNKTEKLEFLKMNKW